MAAEDKIVIGLGLDLANFKSDVAQAKKIANDLLSQLSKTPSKGGLPASFVKENYGLSKTAAKDSVKLYIKALDDAFNTEKASSQKIGQRLTADILKGQQAAAKQAAKEAAAAARAAAMQPKIDYRSVEKASIGKAFGRDVTEVNYAMERFVGKLPQMRYALYDMSNNFAIMGAAAVASAVAMTTVSASYERDFANVVRTTGAAGTAAKNLEKDFIALKQSIPVSWGELTNIGALAGQLNVPQDQIANFTEVVAKFAATTDVSATEAATALGRLNTLLPGVQGNYEALASSILAAGVNSVATESQIIAVTTNIASMGNQAGMTTDQVVGLSAALASAGIAPELARGLTTRLFTEINTAISQGSVKLEEFGRISGLSGKQFAQSWKSDAGATLIKVLKGINAEGDNAQASLANLGITSVRDVPNILKLAQGHEEVARIMGVSAEGFSQANELQKQYAVITATVAEKVNLLTQNLQMFVAASGQGVGLLGSFLDFLNDMVKALTNFTLTPFGSAFATITTSIMGITGIIGILIALLLRGAAGFLAWKTATIDALIATGAFAEGTKKAEVGILAMARALFTASGASKAFGLALKGTGIGLLITVGLSLATVAFESISEAMKSASDRAKDLFGDFETLKQTLATDAQAIANGAEQIGTFTSAIDGSTQAIGRNTAELILNTIQQDENIKRILANADRIKNAGGPILDAPKFLSLYAKGDTEGALKYLQDYQAQADAFYANQSTGQNRPIAGRTGTSKSRTGGGGAATSDVMAAGATSAETLRAALQGVNADATLTDQVMKKLGFDTATTTGEMTDLNQVLSDLQAEVKNAFDAQNIMSTFSSDFENLIQGVREGGNSFSSFSQAGRTNLNNLQSSIASTLAAAQSLGVDASEAVAAMFLELQNQGVDTAQLMSMLSGMNIAGVNNKAVTAFITGQKQLSSSGQKISNMFADVSDSADSAAKSIGGATDKVITLTDYANDLASVFGRAFDIRFSGMQAMDKINKSWSQMREEVSNIRDEINTLNNDINKLTADEALQKYFLSIAELYGDTLRANEIRAQLAATSSELSDKNKDLVKAQNKANKTLVGNSDAAVENRLTIIGLISNYQDYIKSLAASGASQDALSAANAQARNDFMAQATQLGYNSAELGLYAAAFDDVTYAIDNVPRNVTVDADINPAITALNELEARLRSQAGNSYSVGKITVDTSQNDAAMARAGRAASILATINNDQAAIGFWLSRGIPADSASITNTMQDIANLAQMLNSGNYASGGYTGAGGKYQVAGVVHRGEYVVPKSQVNQTTGLPYFMSQMPRYFTGGATVGSSMSQSSNMVALTAGTIQAIAQAVRPMLYLDGQRISDTSSAAYANNTKVGAF